MRELFWILLLVVPMFSLQADMIASSVCQNLVGLDGTELEYLLVEAKPTSSAGDFIDLEILSVLRGELDQTSIRLYDNCSGIGTGSGIAPASSYLVGELILAVIIPVTELSSCGDLDPGSYTPLSNYQTFAYEIVDGFVSMPFFEAGLNVEVSVEALREAEGDWCNVDVTNTVIELLDSELLIYPNPVVDIISIEKSFEELVQVRIYSVFGKLISTSRSADRELSMSAILPGVYFLEFWTASGKHAVRRIVKE